MKRILPLLVALFSLTSLPAFASSTYNWTGFYAGLNGGGSFGRTLWDYQAPGATDDRSHSTSGGVFGGMGGYNQQIGNWVVGGEVDFDWGGISGERTCVSSAWECESTIEALTTFRARGGYAFDDVPYVGHIFPYITAGPGIGIFEIKTTTNGGGGSTQRTPLALTAGLGAEAPIPVMSNLTARLEYLYYSLDEENYTVDNGLRVHASNGGSIIRAGIAYHFGQ